MRVAAVLVGEAGAALDAEPADDRRGSRPWRRRRGASRPLTLMRRTFSGSIARHCDASTSRTCEVPMPNAIAPNAPWVEVWLSPQAIVMPGWVSPSSGPMTWTMPCCPLDEIEQPDAVVRGSCARAPRACLPPSRRETAAADRASARCDRRSRSCARGIATPQPRARSMSNACGVVTSWMRCSR